MEFLKKIRQTYFPQLSDRLLFLCGIIMLSSEIWKQFTLTFLLGGGQYNWWYFPFQLCSIPMYLLIAYPWIRRETLRRVILSFLMCYSLLGGIAVFADTSGLHYPLASLTIHSYLWHIQQKKRSPARLCRQYRTVFSLLWSSGTVQSDLRTFWNDQHVLHQPGLSDAADCLF